MDMLHTLPLAQIVLLIWQVSAAKRAESVLDIERQRLQIAGGLESSRWSHENWC